MRDRTSSRHGGQRGADMVSVVHDGAERGGPDRESIRCGVDIAGGVNGEHDFWVGVQCHCWDVVVEDGVSAPSVPICERASGACCTTLRRCTTWNLNLRRHNCQRGSGPVAAVISRTHFRPA